jgi:hypothetical protein
MQAAYTIFSIMGRANTTNLQRVAKQLQFVQTIIHV